MADSITGSKSYQPEIQGVSIVALGSFNPAIFQPLWFSGNNLIRQEEANEAKVEIIHKDVALFSTEWFSLQVIGDRYAVETKDPTKYQLLRDLALGTFKILEHTPIRAFGFNSNQHFSMPSEEKWHAFGDYYAPKGPWQDIVTNPGMRSLVIEGKRDNCEANQIQMRIGPSRKVHPGVFIDVNQHYEVASDENSNPTDRIVFFLETLRSSWDDFLSYGNYVAQYLLAEHNNQRR